MLTGPGMACNTFTPCGNILFIVRKIYEICNTTSNYTGADTMTIQLTDTEILSLLAEPKNLPENFRAAAKLKPKRGHKEYEFCVSGAKGHEFLLKFRQSEINPLDFSVILLYVPKGSSRQFRLRRYNGKSHEHTNRIEDNTFYEFHIHTATERYQQLGCDEDAFAEPTDRYATYPEALECMIRDCAFTFSTKNKDLGEWGMN
jgi:hypothetical protein